LRSAVHGISTTPLEQGADGHTTTRCSSFMTSSRSWGCSPRRRPTGAKLPLKPLPVWGIRLRPQVADKCLDLALFEVRNGWKADIRHTKSNVRSSPIPGGRITRAATQGDRPTLRTRSSRRLCLLLCQPPGQFPPC
jgi:hypothetical protein